MQDLSILQPKRLLDWPLIVNLYTDASLHNPVHEETSVAQAFHRRLIEQRLSPPGW